MSAREVIREALILNATRAVTTKTNAVLDALSSTGYRILGPDEVDAVTVERCAEVAATAGAFHDGNAAIASAIRALKGGGAAPQEADGRNE